LSENLIENNLQYFAGFDWKVLNPYQSICDEPENLKNSKIGSNINVDIDLVKL
jgi:hypothetical protein